MGGVAAGRERRSILVFSIHYGIVRMQKRNVDLSLLMAEVREGRRKNLIFIF